MNLYPPPLEKKEWDCILHFFYFSKSIYTKKKQNKKKKKKKKQANSVNSCHPLLENKKILGLHFGLLPFFKVKYEKGTYEKSGIRHQASRRAKNNVPPLFFKDKVHTLQYT